MKLYNKLFTISIFIACLSSSFAENSNEKVLKIDELFKLICENNKQLKLAKAGLEITKGAVEVAKTLKLPTVTLRGAVSYLGDATIIDRDFSNSFTSKMPSTGNNFSIEANQVVFAGGAISNSIEKCEINAQIAQLELEQNTIDAKFMALGYYLDIYKVINQIIIYKDRIKETQEIINQIRAKEQEGMALANDILRHELTMKTYDLELIVLNNRKKLLNDYLISSLGLADSVVIMPDSNLIISNKNNYSLNEMKQSARANLPILKSAELSTQAATKGIEIAKAEYYPSIAIVAANYFDGPITIEVPTINKNLNYWYIGLGINYNISSLFTTGKKVALAENERIAASEVLSVRDEFSMLAVQSALIGYNESFDKVNIYEKSLELADKNYRLVNNRYLNDMVLITEMLDASNTKLNAELDVVNAKINIVYNYYKLQHSLGKI